jgi:endogenous inhibitor of DNA gyrase (YacG/DUF329 family)
MSPKSQETKQKMAEARRQWWANLTDEEREQYAEKQRKPHPKTSEAMKGRSKKGKIQTGKWVKCHNDTCNNQIYQTPYQLENRPNPFCSRKCLNEWKRANLGSEPGRDAIGRKARPKNGVTVPCDNCGVDVYRPPYLLEKYPNTFCSSKCSAEYQSKKAREDESNRATCLWCEIEFYRPAGRSKYNGGNHYCCKEHAALGRSGENHPNWKGGRSKRSDGYIDVSSSLVPDHLKEMARVEGKIFEHRLVMAMHLERVLEDHEVVHHKNGVRDDNRIENLELYPKYEHDGVTHADSKRVSKDRRIAMLERENQALRERIRILEARG